MIRRRRFLEIGMTAGVAATLSKEATAMKTELLEVTSFPNAEPVGVAVSRRGRVFITLPYSNYSDERHTNSVVEVLADGTQRSYPSKMWNTKQASPTVSPSEHFLCVQGITVDANDFLWVLDTGSPKRAGVVPGGAKLVKIDLKIDKVVQIVGFDDTVVPTDSYLNDVRVDAARQFAYLSETGAIGGLIVVNLQTGFSRKLPAVDLPTRGEHDGKPTRAKGGFGFPDGITLDRQSEYFYFHATTGKTLFRINTKFLRDSGLSSAVIGSKAEAVGTNVFCDGIEMDTATGYIYSWDTKGKAIVRYKPNGKTEVLLQDKRLIVPDGIAVGLDGYIYFADPQFARLNGADTSVRPFRVYKTQIPKSTF